MDGIGKTGGILQSGVGKGQRIKWGKDLFNLLCAAANLRA